jgi:FkbM family methyltransferase
MKPKEVLYMLGFKPKVKLYGYKINQFELDEYGLVEYAQWLHPGESEKVITSASIVELKTFLSEGDFCIDIGAHTGDTTIPMALAVGKTGAVLALEPNQYVFKILEKNTTLNRRKTNIIPLMAAATLKDGTYEFEYSDSGFCNGGFHEGISKWRHGHAFKLKVRGINLSAELRKNYFDLLRRLKYIKIDTEGYDLSVIKSILDLIAEFHPYLKAEVFKHTALAYRKQMYKLLSDRKYSLYKVNDNDLRGAEIADKDLMNWKHYDIFCEPHP